MTRRVAERAAALLAAVAVMMVLTGPAHADSPVGGGATIGTSSEAQAGDRIVLDGVSEPTMLFPARSRAGLAEPDVSAYCLESLVGARFGAPAIRVGWADFPGSNRFRDPDVQARVGWVLTHSFPLVDLVSLGRTLGVTGLTERQAIAGSQGAIWHFTDGRTISEGNSGNVRAVYAYLTGRANTGLAENQVRPSVTLSGPTDASVAGVPAGPIRVRTNQASVTVVATTTGVDLPVVDGAGRSVDLTAVVDGQELWVEVPLDAEAGSVTFSAEVRGAENHGSLLVTPDGAGGHGQTLIMVDTTQVRADARAVVSWRPAPVTGHVSWSKTDPAGAALAGSTWRIVGPDGVSIDVPDATGQDEPLGGGEAGPDQDPAAGSFLVMDLAAGDYTLSETAAPDGYLLDTVTHEFAVTQRGSTVELGGLINEAAPAPPDQTGPPPAATPPEEVPPAPAAPESTPPQLATTGASGPGGTLIAGALIALLVGATVLAVARRRIF